MFEIEAATTKKKKGKKVKKKSTKTKKKSAKKSKKVKKSKKKSDKPDYYDKMIEKWEKRNPLMVPRGIAIPEEFLHEETNETLTIALPDSVLNDEEYNISATNNA
ncbi:hypothetical protein TcasGA2_TC015739 [Tribolium castaneum]|uniref:Uncharacterized protein n=1 Tax=Tribolium castaneum TaxID=7070 RepID=D2A3R3_TRICA|nr:hypothetical protein TcasGA2_TC015739 [Tribolium castaneum]